MSNSGCTATDDKEMRKTEFLRGHTFLRAYAWDLAFYDQEFQIPMALCIELV